jgi:hypothetical protein
MNKKNLKLLRFALCMCEEMLNRANEEYEVYGYSSDDFYYLRNELSEKLGIDYYDLKDD